MGIPVYTIFREYIWFNEQTGTTYTIVDDDMCKYVRCTNGSAITLTIPTNATLALPVGWNCVIKQGGAGQVTIAGSGITFEATPGLKIRAQHGSATIVKRATDTWCVDGDLAA